MKFKFLILFAGLMYCTKAKPANDLQKFNADMDVKLSKKRTYPLSKKEKQTVMKTLDSYKIDKHTKERIIVYLEQIPHGMSNKQTLAKTLPMMILSIKEYMKKYNFNTDTKALAKETHDKKRDVLNGMIARLMYDLIYNTDLVTVDTRATNIHELMMYTSMFDLSFDKFEKSKTLELDEYGKMLSSKTTVAELNADVLSTKQKETVSKITALSNEIHIDCSDFFLQTICESLPKNVALLISDTYPSKLIDKKQLISHIAYDAINLNKAELTDGNLTIIDSQTKFAIEKLKLCQQISYYNIL